MVSGETGMFAHLESTLNLHIYHLANRYCLLVAHGDWGVEDELSKISLSKGNLLQIKVPLSFSQLLNTAHNYITSASQSILYRKV